MAKKTGRKKEFLTLALVSVIIIVAVFVLAPSNPSGRVVKSANSITQSSTGAVYECIWTGQRFSWYYKYSDGTEIEIPGRISAATSPINCDPNYWYCTGDNRCYASTEGQTCECGKQLSVAYSLGSSS